jgi:putative Ca2+/H+ antiporter (TMEM165/GDT1 family)
VLPAETGALGYSRRMKTYLIVFASVLVAELGDKTQIATLLFATDPASGKLGVFLAAASALVLSSALAVVVGAHAGDWISPKLLRTVAGLGFVAIGVWVLLT